MAGAGVVLRCRFVQSDHVSAQGSQVARSDPARPTKVRTALELKRALLAFLRVQTITETREGVCAHVILALWPTSSTAPYAHLTRVCRHCLALSSVAEHEAGLPPRAPCMSLEDAAAKVWLLVCSCVSCRLQVDGCTVHFTHDTLRHFVLVVYGCFVWKMG